MHFGILFISTVFGFEAYPNCTQSPFLVTSGDAVFVKPSDFLEVGAVADDCTDELCISTGSFRVNSTDSCSIICARLSRCDWWSTTLVFDSPRLNRTVCYLFSTNSSAAVRGVMPENSTSGHRTCSNNLWPSCVVRDSVIPSGGFAELLINAVALLGVPSESPLCNQGQCSLTDTIPTSSVEECAAFCGRIKDCHSWSVTVENGFGHKCWFRRHVIKMIEHIGSVSGDSACGNHSPYRPLNFVTNNL